MTSEEQRIDEVINGKLRIWRFSEAEQSGSSNIADRFLWLAILRAESELASALFGGVPSGAAGSLDGASSPGRFLNGLATPLPKTFNELIAELGQYEDRGRESIVCDGGDGFVNKLRPMVPSSLTGYMAPLANIVYHNRIFPNDRYTLENIYTAGDKYYMVLRQERVEILLDEEGMPIKPTFDQIRDAINALGLGLVEFLGDVERGDSSESADTNGDPERLRFYNGDYLITDLQPGRNVVIDANTKKLRFIDPRISLNDPEGPISPVSRYGKRREEMPGQLFD